ncbi:THUMP-like domain-containing protein [Pedobacter psychroterrae]|uniref:Uncharacterized protein n=1 Tax=Pedobacter psychroterrae TaxID=2530453 RepID=A0A4R0NL01_9SPHI|nr:hypothetical protein [Pedobacter psychroterrae]TCD01460.1 hypothetical protein EZ437_12015 [Pedobacter psychroterrae]
MLNKRILDSEVQEYINSHLAGDVHKIAMGKSPFPGIEARELAAQIAAKKKSVRKLPSIYACKGIYYPALLSIEQCSSETTALYKSGLATGDTLIDLTGGFGIDSLFFARKVVQVTHCEINEELSGIAAHNASMLQQNNMLFIASDGLAHLSTVKETFGTIYIDPARRSTAGKVFMLKDCTPSVVENLGPLLAKSQRVIIKTAPLLDITAGLKELKNVTEIHIVSVRNECKELLWVLENNAPAAPKIVSVTLNDAVKEFSFYKGEELEEAVQLETTPSSGFLYEPDTALLKSGAFNLIASRYGLKKLHGQTQLYHADEVKPHFPGRIFKIKELVSTGELKKSKQVKASVISRNYPDKAEQLVKKYRIKPDDELFLIFTQSSKDGYLIIGAEILQHY